MLCHVPRYSSTRSGHRPPTMALVHPSYEPHGPHATTARLACQSRVSNGGGVGVHSLASMRAIGAELAWRAVLLRIDQRPALWKVTVAVSAASRSVYAFECSGMLTRRLVIRRRPGPEPGAQPPLRVRSPHLFASKVRTDHTVHASHTIGPGTNSSPT